MGRPRVRFTKEDQRQARLDYYRRRRAACIAFLGGKCGWCGFSDSRALQIDHVAGGGVKEAKAIGPHGVMRKVLQGDPAYQLLCANCNQIKKVERDEQPWR